MHFNARSSVSHAVSGKGRPAKPARLRTSWVAGARSRSAWRERRDLEAAALCEAGWLGISPQMVGDDEMMGGGRWWEEGTW